MSHSPRHTRLAVVLIACALSSLPLPATAQTRKPAALSPRAFLAHLADFLGFRSVALMMGLDNGCKMDPSGQCLPQALDLDNGCQMDPNGQCLPQMNLDNGCKMDPDGQPSSFCSTGQ